MDSQAAQHCTRSHPELRHNMRAYDKQTGTKSNSRHRPPSNYGSGSLLQRAAGGPTVSDSSAHPQHFARASSQMTWKPIIVTDS